MKNPFRNAGKKIVRCPVCRQNSRIPVRPGKTLEVSCPSCRNQFQVQFKNPLLDFFTWYKGQGILYNLKSFRYRFKLLPLGLRIRIWVVIFLMAYGLMGFLSGKGPMKESGLRPVEKKQLSPYAIEI